MASMDSPQGDAPVAVAARPTSTAARKELYLAEEQELQNLVSSDEFPLHFQAWMDQTVAELDSRFATCDDALQELSNYGAPPEQDKGSYWNTDTLIRHCNLTVGKQSLFHRGRVLDVGEHATWRHMIVFKATLRLLQERMVGQKDFLQSVQAELGRGKDGIIFEPQDLATMARALETKLADETVDHSSTADLDELDVSVEKLAPLVHELEELIDKAMDDGHVALGESESAKQLQLFENQLSLLAQQYPVIDKRHTDSTGHHRRRRWHIFRMASRDISSILEAKLRQQEACRADQARIDEQVANYKLDDRALRKRYRLDCSESRDFLMQNKDKQKAVWNSIHALLQSLRGLQGELKSLAEERQVEVQRRLRVEELETSRRQGYDAFQAVATEHRRLLEETIDNAARAHDFSKTLNSFVLDQSASVTERYDVQQRKLQDRLHRLREKHLDVFTQYALKVGRLIDRKELHLARVKADIEKENALRELKVDVLDPAAKGHADKIKELQAQARELRYEISLVTANYNKFDERVETEVVRPFDLAGHKYEHPRDLVVRISKIRFNKTVDCREAVNERHLIEHQREQLELRRQAIEEDAHTAVAAVRTPVAPPEAQHRTSHSVRYGKLLDRLSDMSATIPDMRDDDPNRPATVAQPQGRPALPPGSAVGFQVTGYEGAPPSAAQADGIRDGSTVRAKFTYEAQDPDELSFFKNDVFTAVCRAHDAGWYMGIHGERQGLFPGNYVEPINAAAPQLGHMKRSEDVVFMSTTVQHSPAPHRRRSLSRASTGEPIPITGGPPLSASAVRAHDRLASSQRSSSGLPSPNHPQNLPLGMSPGHRRQGSNGSNRGGSAPHPGMVPHFSAATPQRADSARRPPPAAHPAPSLTLSQQALYFPLPLTRNIENVVDIVNTETHDVFFKVKSSTPTRYVTKPRIGVLKAGEELRMRVTLFASSAAVHGKLPDESSNDRFHFEARFVEPGDDVANPASVWKLRKDAPGLARVILPCVFKAGDIPDSFVVCNSVPNTPSSARNSVSETPASAITQRSAAPGATPTPARGPLFPAGSSQARADSEAPLLQDPPSRLPRNPPPAVPHDRSAPHRHSSSTLDTPPLAPKAGTAPPTPEGSPINPAPATNATTNGAATSAAAAMPVSKSAPVAARPPPYTPRPKAKKQGLLMRLLLASLPTVIVVPAMFLALWFGITAHTDPFRTAPLLLG